MSAVGEVKSESMEEFMNENPFEPANPMFQFFVKSASPEALYQKLSAMADDMGYEAFAQRVAGETVERTRPDRAIPEIYADYRLLVRDGIEFFLSRIDCQRLLDLAVEQLKMGPTAESEERLLALAKRFPTLHKLGQIIARNPNIDPEVKKWLIQLENGHYGTPEKGILEQIQRQLEPVDSRERVEIAPAILAEASVGAVVAFEHRMMSDAEPEKGVFKILRPGIRKHLDEELGILEQTAAFFEENRERYPLKNFKFLEIFQDVREMLIKEIDLAAEQAHLAEAARFYDDMDGVCIPRLLPFGTSEMTAMAYLHGPKITDADLGPEQRKELADILFEALVCRPLFCRREAALFHGDPHAGNILAVMDAASDTPRIGLLDWSLAGRLAKGVRVGIVQLIQSLFKKDLSGILNAIPALAGDASADPPMTRPKLRDLILDMMHERGFARQELIKKAFRMLESLAHEGWVFPVDLMLFRKAIFTLEGVLHDLWPAFNMDANVIAYLTALMSREMPLRLGNLLFPLADRPENYPSLISNTDLQSLMVHQYAAMMKAGSRTWVASLMRWHRVCGMSFGLTF